MLENEPNGVVESAEATGGEAAEVTSTVRRTRRRTTSADDAEAAPKKTTARAKKADDDAAPKRSRKKVVDDQEQIALEFDEPTAEEVPAEEPPAAEEETRRTRRRTTSATFSLAEPPPPPLIADEPDETAPTGRRRRPPAVALFQPPDPALAVPVRAAAPAPVEEDDEDEEEAVVEAPRTSRSRRRRRGESVADEPVEPVAASASASVDAEADEDEEEDDEDEDGESASSRRRRRRGRRGRGRGKGPHEDDDAETEADAEAAADEDDTEAGDGMTRRRRRRRRRGAGGEDGGDEEGVVTVVKIREPRAGRDEVQGVSGSTRLEAKRQRRRDGREQRRTRPAILSESEFLARREAVDRVMAIRQKGDRTQIAVLEDGVLVEHYVTRASSGSMVGNVYLGKVQNVLPSMEAAFVDIGRGRNAVLYAGEVNWDMAGLEGRARSIEQALKSGDSVLVQVTKDPIGHKGARLTSHVALSGRHLVYVPNGNASGISRKLSDVERKRLRDILKRLIPEGAGVIVRTAAEGASEEELERDVTRLQAQWADISGKVKSGGAPVQLYEEPDLVIRVVRDLFNEDFRELVVQGSDAYELVESYLGHVSPDLVERLKRHTGTSDIFATYRVDEQILKGLDRKVFLPSGGSLVIDRTEAMTVVDVNTGKYTGAGGNLEETVTRNNLEAAEEIVRQLRLRDLGGIIVIDFIDMVLESNRELVLRRLTECLGRDRTKHQVTEITSLGLVQMTRKRIGQGLLEAFSETCEHCKGRGVIMHLEPVAERRPEPVAAGRVEHAHIDDAPEPVAGGRRRGRRGRGGAKGADTLVDEASVDEALIDEALVEEALVEEGLVEVPPADEDEFDDLDDADEMAEAVVEVTPFVAPVVTWQPPKTSSWVNLGAAPPISTTPETGDSPVAEVADSPVAGVAEAAEVEVADSPVAGVAEAAEVEAAEEPADDDIEHVEPVTAHVTENADDAAIGVVRVDHGDAADAAVEDVVFAPVLVESEAINEPVPVDLGIDAWSEPADRPADAPDFGDAPEPAYVSPDYVGSAGESAAAGWAPTTNGDAAAEVAAEADDAAGWAPTTNGEVTAEADDSAAGTVDNPDLDALESEIEADASGGRRRWRLRG